MHAAQIESIDDIEALRRFAIEALAASESRVSQREHEIAAQRALIAERDAKLAASDRTIAYKTTENEALKLEIARLRRLQFAAKSERFDPAQQEIFDEAIAADLGAAEAKLDALIADADANADASTPAKPRNIPQRRPLPPELPRVEVRHEPASCTCGSCGGALHPIGEQVSEKLDLEPLKFFVRRDVYPQYACRACETITAAPVAPAIIDRGIAAPGLLAHVTIGKYVDHQPLYRQETQYERAGVPIPRNVQAEWIGRIGVALAPLAAALKADLLVRPILHADETPVGQLDPGRGKVKRAYLFAYRSADHTGPPIILFDYGENRSGEHVREFLGDWRGALMVDDYAGYKKLFDRDVVELGCWVRTGGAQRQQPHAAARTNARRRSRRAGPHARRKFHELHVANRSPIAAEALTRIGDLYAIEAEAREAGLDPTALHALRQAQAKPRVEAFKAWLDETRPKVLGASGMCRAIDYTLKRWPALMRYLDDGRHPIDNNPIENAIRPIALGRKNWLFAGSERAGERAAIIMGLLATAKANGHEPHAWLSDVLTRLPTTKDSEIGTLLPHTWRPAAG